jgi:hypothetical protein
MCSPRSPCTAAVIWVELVEILAAGRRDKSSEAPVLLEFGTGDREGYEVLLVTHGLQHRKHGKYKLYPCNYSSNISMASIRAPPDGGFIIS